MSQSDRDLGALDLECLWHPMLQHQGLAAAPRRIERGEGCFVYDAEGNRWLDGVSGLWCVNVGHGRAELADVAREQMAKLAYSPLTMSHEPAIRLAAKIVEWLGYPGKVYFSNSGSEANEAAFKIARQYHAQTGGAGRHKIIARYRGYHGNTLGALSATGQAERRLGYEPLVPGFVFTEAPDSYRQSADCAEALEQTILHEGADSVAAFIMEPIIAGGGVLLPPDDYLPRVREICTRHGVLLILDEVVTGFCRTGARFAHQRAGVQPDIITFAKGIASGYVPLGATVARNEIFAAFGGAAGGLDHFRHINTYAGHPVSTAVALRNIEILERERLEENAAAMGERLLTKLQPLLEQPNVGDVRGKGLLLGIELVADRATREPMEAETLTSIAQRCAEHGLIIGRTTNATPGLSNVLILAPPLILLEEEADLIARTLEEALLKVLPADATAR
ncbi:MAG: aminotransferase class III-fold pyridoxal phosphate-dependent enzyme [Deltaproteobacteria bacterium]|nr:aminotransferase class III-fold pyridoxal phosphate-dependent enzyme [Deltaproteobacteria bacterium]MBW2359350.1 aminotransferase class III-fold pyridoxal phosphate-dependent enzyme [Deltaproteobacteria bacterium]